MDWKENGIELYARHGTRPKPIPATNPDLPPMETGLHLGCFTARLHCILSSVGFSTMEWSGHIILPNVKFPSVQSSVGNA